MCTSPFPSPLSFYSLLFNVATLPEFFATFVTLTAACAREVTGVPFFYSPSLHFLLHFPPFLSVACLFLLLSFFFFPVSYLLYIFSFFHFVSSFSPLNFIASLSFHLFSLFMFFFFPFLSLPFCLGFLFLKSLFYIRTFFFILLCTCTSLVPPLFFFGVTSQCG